MGKAYIARCKCGGVVAAAVADTPLEQAECAKDVKRWSKKFTVELVEAGENIAMPEWCENRGKCT